MSTLEVRAEIIKLARLFDLPTSDLGFLYALPADSIQTYRERAEEKLFSDDITLFRRLSAASKLIPTGLVGLLGQHVFGPVLSARVAGEMDYRRAVKLAMKLPVDYLADICLHLDPRRAKDIIHNVPAARIREVSLALLAREEYITMGRFVGYLTDEAIKVTIQAFEDEADLLMVGFFVEDKPRLDHIFRLLPDDRLRATLNAAQSDTRDLWAEAVALMAFVDDDLKRKLGDMAADQDESVLEGLLATAHEQQLWADVLPIVACMSPESQRKLSELDALAERDVMTPILETAHHQHLWDGLLPLVDTMPQAQLHTAADALTRDLGQSALEQVLREAAHQDLWAGVLPLFDAMGTQQAQRIGAAMAILSQAALTQAVQRTDEHQLWYCLLPLAEHIPQAQRTQLARAIGELPHAAIERLVAAADASHGDLQARLLNMCELMPQERREALDDVLQSFARR